MDDKNQYYLKVDRSPRFTSEIAIRENKIQDYIIVAVLNDIGARRPEFLPTMAPNYGKCAGCLNILQKREFLTCAACKKNFDINCAKVSPKRFHSFYSAGSDRKNNWHCSPECTNKGSQSVSTTNMLNSKTSKRDSSIELTTPASSDNTNSEKSNITLRKIQKQNSQSEKSDDESPIISRGVTCIKSSSFLVSEDRLRNFVNDELKKPMKQHVTAELKNITE